MCWLWVVMTEKPKFYISNITLLRWIPGVVTLSAVTAVETTSVVCGGRAGVTEVFRVWNRMIAVCCIPTGSVSVLTGGESRMPLHCVLCAGVSTSALLFLETIR